MSRLHSLAIAATLAVLTTGASATVNVSTSGNTTTYTENFDGGTSFTGGVFGLFTGGDDYLWVETPSLFGIPTGRPSSATFTFTAAQPIASLQLSFWYAARDAGAGVTLDRVGGGNVLNQTASGAPLLAYLATNPGAGSGASDFADTGVLTFSTPLAAGDYALTFFRGAGGLKVDDLTLSVTAVPEPGTWALMLAGLGVVGFVAARRRQA